MTKFQTTLKFLSRSHSLYLGGVYRSRSSPLSLSWREKISSHLPGQFFNLAFQRIIKVIKLWDCFDQATGQATCLWVFIWKKIHPGLIAKAWLFQVRSFQMGPAWDITYLWYSAQTENFPCNNLTPNMD